MTIVGAVALLVAPAALVAQQGDVETIDRIAAMVGQRAILLSEIDEDINQRRSQGLQVPDDPAALNQLRQQVLGDLIDEEVIYQAARRDTGITVTDAEVQQSVDQQFREIRGRFRSDTEMNTALRSNGFVSLDEWRRWITDLQRRYLYRTRYVQKLRGEGKLRGGAVPEDELRRAYEAARTQPGERQRRPPAISFRQIVIAPRPTEQARARALVRAESIRTEIAGGADFATMARRVSQDDGSREQGGDLGWFRRGDMVREFSDVAFSLRPGVVSPVVRSPFGYHLIQVERIQPAEVKARHILITPEITDADIDSARVFADSMARLVRLGASVDSLARLHGDSSEPRLVGPLNRTQLDSSFAAAFDSASVGSIVGPFTVAPGGSRQRLRVVVAEVTELEPEREFSYEEVRDNIRQQLQQQRAIQGLIESLRRQTYIDIRI